MYFFCYTTNKLRFKRGSNRLFLGLTNLQKQVYTFANKSIYFYVCLEFFMCTIPHFFLKKYVWWSKMIDYTFFLLKFKINYMLLSITLQWHTLCKVKKAYYKALIECTYGIRIYAHKLFFHKLHVQTKESQGSCTNKSQLPVHIVQRQRFTFDMVITHSPPVRTLGSNAIIEFIVIYSSC